jgi:PST family polysaccharide transporter
VAVLRNTSLLLGIFGAVVLIVFCTQVSKLTFGSDQYSFAVALLSLAVLFRLVSLGQGALIQGMRRIGDLAMMGVLGALLGTIVTVAMVYFLGEQGLAPSLVVGAAIGLVISWWYSRRVRFQRPAASRSELRIEAGSLLKLGVAFMVSGFLMMGAAYAVRSMVLHTEGLNATGYYHAAWTLGGLYAGIVLQAMGADFYPRLVGVVSDRPTCNRLVNEQVQASLLLAGPGVIATLTLAPLILTLFYSTKFSEATELLRWITLGVALRVVTWPMGYIVVAKNRQLIFLAVELGWTSANVSLTWLCLQWFELNGAGIAFFGSYVLHGVAIYPIVRRLTGFRWSPLSKKLGALFLALISVVFAGFFVLPSIWGIALGLLSTIASGVWSIHVLSGLVPAERVPRLVQRIVALLRRTRVAD